MEPASVVSLVGGCLALILRTSRDINELIATAKNVDRNATFILGRLATVRATICQLQSWLDSESNIHEQTVADLRSAIEACEAVVGEIHAHVLRVKSGWLGGSLRHLWDEGQLLAHQNALDSQTAALGIFLNALLLKSSTQQRQLLERLESRLAIKNAQDNASVYSTSNRILDTSNSNNAAVSNSEFGFDNDLIESDTYRRAMTQPLPYSQSTTFHIGNPSNGSDSGINIDSETIATFSTESSGSTRSSIGSRLSSGSKSWRNWAGKSRTTNGRKLCEAAWHGDTTEVVRLCNEGADVNCKGRVSRLSSDNDTRSVAKSRSLLRRITSESQSDISGTPLHYAAEGGHLDVVRLLKSYRADLNLKNEDGKTPLHVAAEDTVQTLVSLGADPLSKDDGWNTPLHYAAKNGHLRALRALLNPKRAVHAVNALEQTPLHLACGEGHTEIVISLLEAGTYKNPPDSNGLRPLHYAARKGHVDIIKVLIHAGADIEAPSKQRWTALHCSASEGHAEATSVLIKAGANIEASAERNKTPLHLAIENSKDQAVETLLQFSARVEAETESHDRPLDLAIRAINWKLAKLLIEHEADINFATQGSSTRLLTICSTPGPIEHVISIARLLLENGADVNAKSHLNQSPLSAACSRPHSALDLVRLLLQYNAQVRSADFLALWRNDGVSLWEKRVIFAALNEVARPELRRDEVEWLIMLI